MGNALIAAPDPRFAYGAAMRPSRCRPSGMSKGGRVVFSTGFGGELGNAQVPVLLTLTRQACNEAEAGQVVGLASGLSLGGVRAGRLWS